MNRLDILVFFMVAEPQQIFKYLHFTFHGTVFRIFALKNARKKKQQKIPAQIKLLNKHTGTMYTSSTHRTTNNNYYFSVNSGKCITHKLLVC